MATLVGIIKKLDRRIWSLRHPAVLLAIEKAKKDIWIEDRAYDKRIEIVDTSGVGRIYKSRTIVDILNELET